MGAIDLVYPLGKGSHHHDHELRFSLRSVEKYLSGFRKVWIVGECPPWVQNVNHIPYRDAPNWIPDYNIMKKVARVIEEPDLTDQFLFMNDDHFILQPFEAAEFPYYYSENLVDYCAKRGKDGYGNRARATLKHLQDHDLPTKHFDVHAPIIYDKALFLQHVTNAVDWENGTGFIIKSMYANSLKFEGVKDKDNKLNTVPTEGMKVFSTMPRVKSCIFRFLIEQFPKMSRFEKTGI